MVPKKLGACQRDVDKFYSIIARLMSIDGQALPLKAYRGKSQFPRQGVYFFLEPGECRASSGDVARIVRVGTHAVSANSKTTLGDRLLAHRGSPHGGGNHRGSVFRKHVGAAILAREGWELPTWGQGASAPPALRASVAARDAEAQLEQLVTERIGLMTVVWIEVPGASGPNSARARIERNAIALLSNHLDPIDKASPQWLGRSSPQDLIRRSGLWNLRHVAEDYDPGFLGIVESFLGA